MGDSLRRRVSRSFGKHTGHLMPPVADVTHDESVVEGNTACGKCRLVGKE
jgi:hypothetical protein